MTTPEKLFHDLLGLGLQWEVAEARFDRVRSVMVLEVRETAALW